MRLGRHIAIAAIAGTGASASGALIVHDNRDQSFRWDAAVDAFGDFIPGTFLDVRQPAAMQSGAGATTSSFGFVVRDPPTSNGVADWGVFAGTLGGGIAAGNTGFPVGGSFLFPARTFAIGDTVGPNATFTFEAPTTAFTFAETTPMIGDRAVVGVLFDIEGSTHYGWIELSVEPNGRYQPTGWAWETNAGVPAGVVAIPGVGTTSLVIAGGIATRRRRR